MSAKSWGHSPQNVTALRSPSPPESREHVTLQKVSKDLCHPGEGQEVLLLGLLSCPLATAAAGYFAGQGNSYTLAQPHRCQPCILSIAPVSTLSRYPGFPQPAKPQSFKLTWTFFIPTMELKFKLLLPGPAASVRENRHHAGKLLLCAGSPATPANPHSPGPGLSLCHHLFSKYQRGS